MHKIFVSYSRSDKSKVKKLIPLLREVYGLENVWWDENFYGGQVWWEEIRQQIAECDVFVYLMSPRSLGSPYCLAELDEAKRLRKPILPVKLRRETQVPDVLARLQFVNLSGQINRAAIPPLLRAINQHASRPPSTLPPLGETPVALPQIPPSDPRNWLAEYAMQILIAIIATIVGGVILAMIIRDARFAEPPEPTVVVGANTLSPLQIAAATQTRDAFEFAQTLDALEAADAAAQRQTATAFAPTQQAEILLTVDAINTATRAAFQSQATQNAAATFAALPTPDPLQAAYAQAAAYDYRNGNGAWTPTRVDFDGVAMMLVPPGCFMMGSNEGNADEQPVHEQCFDAPFWIDETEVTQADFDRLGGEQANSPAFSGADRPVENITWFEARNFCALRGMRLPTEREWEYAARGPEGWLYPWLGQWNGDNAVWSENSNRQTAAVGSRPAGASWVGALDMAGNVWEWVNTIYGIDDGDYNFTESGERLFTYPYSATDGREQDSDDRTLVRVLRGGSWDLTDSPLLRGADRGGLYPDYWFGGGGFRCARSS
jgi:formylglycine-generating enzyme